MLTRIVVGILGASTYTYINFATNGLPFALGVALFAVIGVLELYRAVRNQGGEPSQFLGCLACIVFQIVAWTHNGGEFAPYLPALLLLLVLTTLLTELGKRRPKPIVTIGTTLLGAVYVGWLFSYLTLLHGMQPGMIRHNGADRPLLVPPFPHTTPGEWLVIFVSACTWLSDTGALFVGKAFGRHKLAPNVSPGKTWEGSLGGLAASALAGVALGPLAAPAADPRPAARLPLRPVRADRRPVRVGPEARPGRQGLRRRAAGPRRHPGPH